MTEELLQQWLRGELAPDRRREVTRWMIGCTDPDLPALLEGMLEAQRQEQADAALPARMRVLADAWNDLLARGRARLVTGLSTPLVLASANAREPARPLLEMDDSTTPPTLRYRSSAAHLAIITTDDSGQVDWLVRPRPSHAGQVPVDAQPGRRPTAWLIQGDALHPSGDALSSLTGWLLDDDLVIVSIRFQPE